MPAKINDYKVDFEKLAETLIFGQKWPFFDQKRVQKNRGTRHFAQLVIKILPFPGDLDPLGPKSIIILLFGIPPLAPTGPVLGGVCYLNSKLMTPYLRQKCRKRLIFFQVTIRY